MSIPNDPFMLLSYINTQLRDYYKNLDELCEALDIDKAYINSKLNSIDYEYDQTLNKFC